MTFADSVQMQKGLRMSRTFYAMSESLKRDGNKAGSDLFLTAVVDLPMSVFIRLAETFEQMKGGKWAS